ncbi:eukaryotic porin-domain-containing protein [Schizophyllum commune]
MTPARRAKSQIWIAPCLSRTLPPLWKDLGKSANDLLSTDYPFNVQALEVKTKPVNGVQFCVAGSRAAAPGPINGELEGKYTDKAHGLTLTQAWTTSNVLRTQIELENLVAKGTKSPTLDAVFKQSGVHTRAALDVIKGPTVTADAVVGRDGFLVGAETSYSVTDGTITKWPAALGHTDTLHGLNKFSTFHVSYYYRVSKDVEGGAKAVYNTKALPRRRGVRQGEDQSPGRRRARVMQAVRPGVKAAFDLALDTTKLCGAVDGSPLHKVSFQYTFDT